MAKIYEKSSGGVVYRKKDNKVEVLLLTWRNSKNEEEYVIPKGHIEDNEIAKDAAVREIEEETGLSRKDLEVIKFITKINYTFTAGHKAGNPLIDKDVYLFLVKYTGDYKPDVQKEERFTGYKWATLDEIKKTNIKFDLPKMVFNNLTYFI
jgi:8-oxo-dGTP pyrophosphatase MutT (NUDIX family)